MIAHMEQKYRLLKVGEVIEAGDEWQPDGRDAWRLVEPEYFGNRINFQNVRRPVSEVNIHGSGTVSVDAAPPEYRILNPGDVIQEGDEVNCFGKWRPYLHDAFGMPVRGTHDARRPVAAIPQEYRDLTFDDFIQPGDEVWEFGNGPWEPVSVSEHGQQYRHGYWKMRRPVAAEETITEVREAWQKDHMEMKRKLDAAEAKLAKIENATLRFRGYREVTGHDAVSVLQDLGELIQKRNREITLLTRRTEDALSDKVIAEKRLKNLEHHLETEHVASWRKIQQVLPEFVRNLDLSLVDQVVKCIMDLRMTGDPLDLCQFQDAAKELGKLKAENEDLKKTLNDAMKQVIESEIRISKHHKEADRLTRQNEELSKASYQLNTIKQAFQFIKES